MLRYRSHNRSAAPAALWRLGLLTALVASASQPVAAQQAGPDLAAGRYFVAFRPTLTDANVAQVAALGIPVLHEFRGVRALAIAIQNPSQYTALQQNPNVEYLEPEPMRYGTGLAGAQLTAATSNGLYGLITTKALDAQSRGVAGMGINVGVADTGLDYTHPDIAPNYRGGIDIVGGDSNPWWNNDATETHGTHVAGTILGANNLVGVLGVAPAANLYHARVLGPNAVGTSSDVMAGVQWLVETARCRVVNLSLGGRVYSATEENFYNLMRSTGALIVCAAGNDSATSLSYPAGYAANIAVGAVDASNAIAPFSNKGTNLDLVGPGAAVLSAVPNNQGWEASVVTTSPLAAIGMQYAAATPGLKKTLINCGIGAKAADFPATVAGGIALVQRGTNSFADKVTRAMNAGAVGVILYNNVAGDFRGTLGSATTGDGRAWVPAVTVSSATGGTLKKQTGKAVTIVNLVSSWDRYDGTSMATAHVTGVIALIWSAAPTLTNTTVESYLFTTCADLGARGYDTTFGRGLVNASAAVAKTGK